MTSIYAAGPPRRIPALARELVVQNRTLLQIAVCVSLIGAGIIAYRYYRYFDAPRRELLTDVNRASSIIVNWHVKEAGGLVNCAYRLDRDSHAEFVRKLENDLGVDYWRRRATVTPSIGLYLMDDHCKLIAYYAIRYARGGGTSPSMKSLREIAAKGVKLTDAESSSIYTNDLRSEWPHDFGFDYTLPVTGY